MFHVWDTLSKGLNACYVVCRGLNVCVCIMVLKVLNVCCMCVSWCLKC